MDIRERSDLQLLRISHGALELTHMIDSWSRASTLGIKSTQMANELLRGSLELQESLEMLSRLQEASRKMCKKRIRQRGREEEDEESYFMAMSSKSYGSSCYKLQEEPRLSVDCSANSVEELKQVIRDRLCGQNLSSLKSNNGKAFLNSGLKFTGRKMNISSQTKKIEAPSLIAKLMGLEEFPLVSKDHQRIKQEEETKDNPEQKSLQKIIETMRFKGILNDHSVRHRAQTNVNRINFDKDDEILPIVILKSVNLPPWNGEESNSASEKISEREKTTLAELLLEEKTSDHVYMPVKKNLKYNTEKIQNLTIGVDLSQKQQEKEINIEIKTTVNRKNSVIQGKKFAQLKEVKAIRSPVNTTFVESTKSEKGRLTSKFKCRENKSREKPVRKFINENKTDDQKVEDGKLISSGTETRAVSRSNSMVVRDGLLEREKKETIIFVNKDEIKNDHKILCEVRPRLNQARNSRLIEQSTKGSTTNPAAKSQHLFKNQLLNSKSFHDCAYGLFRINAGIPIHFPEKNSEDLEVGDAQLLLDCAKELMALKSHKENISINQMLQPNQRKGSRFFSFNNLLEEISNGIEELASYRENGEVTVTKNSLCIILEKDLNAHFGRNNWVCFEEVDQVAAEVEKLIISRLIMEVAMDLVALE